MSSFRDLWIWQKAYKLMLEIHQICKTLPRDEKFRLRDQVERSSSSVADNIAEGYSSYYYQEKIKSMYVSRKEAGETQNHIKSMEGKGYINSQKANELIAQYEKLVSGINSFINYIREKREKDNKKGRAKH